MQCPDFRNGSNGINTLQMELTLSTLKVNPNMPTPRINLHLAKSNILTQHIESDGRSQRLQRHHARSLALIHGPVVFRAHGKCVGVGGLLAPRRVGHVHLGPVAEPDEAGRGVAPSRHAGQGELVPDLDYVAVVVAFNLRGPWGIWKKEEKRV